MTTFADWLGPYWTGSRFGLFKGMWITFRNGMANPPPVISVVYHQSHLMTYHFVGPDAKSNWYYVNNDEGQQMASVLVVLT